MALDRPFLISPPFGSYLRHSRAYSVLGSYTVEARPGRFGRIVRTVRPVPSDAGPAWINKIGLRNPGIRSISTHKRRDSDGVLKPYQILSLAPLIGRDWHALERWLDELRAPVLIEFNVSCPNVDEHPDLPLSGLISRLLANCPDAIFKLPPVAGSVDAAAALHDAGVGYVHLSNTYPTPIGGLSGAPLREINLPLVEKIARGLPSLTIVAGGGIYAEADVAAYASAGAKMFSASSAFFKPWRGLKIFRSSL